MAPVHRLNAVRKLFFRAKMDVITGKFAGVQDVGLSVLRGNCAWRSELLPYSD
jgi:hypothetical protein